MSQRTGTAPPPPEPMPSGLPPPRWGGWQRARGIAPTAGVAAAFIGIAYWNVVAEDRRPAPAVTTGAAAGPRTNEVAFKDHPERTAHEETLRALQKMRDADLAFMLAIEETLEENRVAPPAAAREAKRRAEAVEARAAAQRQAALQEATRRPATGSETERQAAIRDVKRLTEEAIRQEAAREAKRDADEGLHQAARQAAKRQPVEAAATPVPPSPSAPAPVGEQATPPTESEPESAPGLLVKVRPGETLQTLYLRFYRGLTPPPFESVAAINPERIRPGDILIFPAPVNGWAERTDADAVSSTR